MKTTRRTFLKTGGAAAAGALAVASAGDRVRGAGDRMTVGIIGCGGRGLRLGTALAGMDGVRVAGVCDPDEARRERAKQKTKARAAVADMRRLLDDASIDAVVIATPDHWHGPAAILACEAGKHVYVEKPCSHNVREGRLMVEAARRQKRVVQVGSQSRSSAGIREAVALLRDGAVGEVKVAKAINSQRRKAIGRAEPSEPPDGLDYDLWVGPAPMRPYQKNLLPYHWHWFHAFGTGDIGNDGVHELDIARWGLGVEGHPAEASGWAARMAFNDDWQFPDTYYVAYAYPGDGSVGGRRLLVYEQRDFSPYHQEGFENGNVFYGTEGMLILSKGGDWRLYGEKNKLLKEGKAGLSDTAHLHDFLDAARAGREPNADVLIGHHAAALAHLGNIVGRLGRSVRFDPKTERIPDDAEADALTRRTYRDGHWAVPKGV